MGKKNSTRRDRWVPVYVSPSGRGYSAKYEKLPSQYELVLKEHARLSKAAERAARARNNRWEPEEQRDAPLVAEVTRLKRLRNLSNKNIAERVGISPVRVQRILQRKK